MPLPFSGIKVTPKVLSWARESLGLSIDEVIHSLKISPQRLINWETGEELPTLPKLEKLASIYKRPLAVFFLPNPPKEPPPPKDFRVLSKSQSRALSLKTLLAIRRARRIQALAIELANNIGQPLTSKLISVTLTDDIEAVEAIAVKWRNLLGIGIEIQKGWRDETEALNGWIAAVELCGILVLQQSIPLNDARGFSITDGPVPVIVLNTKDAINGRIFTLLHECCHVLLHDGGICNIHDHREPVEQFCNYFAGSCLVPWQSLKIELQNFNEEILKKEWHEDIIRRISRIFKVSPEVVLRRILIHGLTSTVYYNQMREHWQRERRPFGGFAPPPEKRCLRNNGMTFARLVLQNYASDKIHEVQVADYLGTKIHYITKIESLLAERLSPNDFH